MKQHLVERELTTEGPALAARASNGGSTKRRTRTVTVNVAESSLSWLHARGHLSDRRFAAGELLRTDWERAQLSPRVTMQWEPVRIAGTQTDLTPGERQIAAKARFDGAISAAGPGLEDVLWRVVCAGEALPVAEKALGWPVRSGKLVLGIALDRVADFHRLPK